MKMDKCFMQHCDKPATYKAISKEFGIAFYCNKCKQYQERNNLMHWKNFERIKKVK
jgi:hypothetical protein